MNEQTSSTDEKQMPLDNAVVRVKKGQALCIIVEGYEDHASIHSYEDVLVVVLQQAIADTNKIKYEKMRKTSEAEMKAQACASSGSGLIGGNLNLYPR